MRSRPSPPIAVAAIPEARTHSVIPAKVGIQSPAARTRTVVAAARTRPVVPAKAGIQVVRGGANGAPTQTATGGRL